VRTLDKQILRLGIELQVLLGVGSTDTDKKNNTPVVERVIEETLGFLGSASIVARHQFGFVVVLSLAPLPSSVAFLS
jgi:hypothetical protein